MHPIFFCTFDNILGVLNLDVETAFGVLTFRILCVMCNLNRFHSFIFIFCITNVHTLNMCTRDAGPEQSLVFLLSVPVIVQFYHAFSFSTKTIVSLVISSQFNSIP